GGGRHRPVKLCQLEPAVAVRRSHHRDVDPDVVDPDDAVDPTSLDGRLTFALHPELDEEGDCGVEVVDDHAGVVQSPDRHGQCNATGFDTSWKKSLPLSSTTMNAGKSTTSIFHTASMPSSGYSSTSTLVMQSCARRAAGPPIEPR